MKAFISSTFDDLLLYRKAASEVLSGLGIVVEKMEDSYAAPESPDEVFQQKVES